jgi:hypothetical protein
MQGREAARLDDLRQGQRALLVGGWHRVAIGLSHCAGFGEQAVEGSPGSIDGADVPIGSRTAAVMSACAQMKASLPHSTVLMVADNSAATLACSQQASRRRAAGWRGRPAPPKVMLAGPPLCTIIPGSAIRAKMNAAAPITWSSLSTQASFSSFSIPFCSDSTAMPSPTSGPSRAAAASQSWRGTGAAGQAR